MDRELGISREDLPHNFDADRDENSELCTCGREKGDPLHVQPRLQETAGYSGPMFETEKGS